MRQPGRLAIAVGVVVVIVAAAVFWLGRAPSIPAPPAAQTTAPTTAAPADDDGPDETPPGRRVLLGEVSDRDGHGIARAVVVIEGAGGVERARAVADDDGRFSIDPMPGDAVAFAFSAEGFLTARVDATALPAIAEAFWAQTLEPDPSRRVIQVRAGDVDVADARLFRIEPLPARPADAVAVSDGRGRAFVGGDVEGALVAAHPAHGAAFVDGNVARLPPGGVLALRVVDDDRRPVAGARVLVRATPPPGDDPLAVALRVVQRRLPEVESDADGLVRWPAPDGSVVVEVGATGFRPFNSDERVRAGRDTEVVVRLSRSVVVVGVVTDATTGAPVAGAIVRGDAGGRVGAEASTDDEGRFELAGFDARPSSLTVRKRGYRILTIGSIDGAASRVDPLRLELTPGSGEQVVGIGVSVRVVDGKVTVGAVEPGSPAEAAGLVAGDVIISVDGVDLGPDLADTTGRIRGQVGTPVQLGVVSDDGRRRSVELERQVIAVQPRGRRR